MQYRPRGEQWNLGGGGGGEVMVVVDWIMPANVDETTEGIRNIYAFLSISQHFVTVLPRLPVP